MHSVGGQKMTGLGQGRARTCDVGRHYCERQVHRADVVVVVERRHTWRGGTQQHSEEQPRAATSGGWMGRNAPSRTPGGAVGTLCHAYGGRNQRRAAVDRHSIKVFSVVRHSIKVFSRASARWSACPRATSRRRWVSPAPDPHLAGKLVGCSGCSARQVRAEASSPGRSGAASPCGPRRRIFRATQNTRGNI